MRVMLIAMAFVMAVTGAPASGWPQSAYPEFSGQLKAKALLSFEQWREKKAPSLYYQSIFAVDSALQMDPANPDLWMLKGTILMHTGQRAPLTDALTAFLQAALIRPDDYGAQLMVAKSLFALGLFDRAAAQYEYVFKTFQGDALSSANLYEYAASLLASPVDGSKKALRGLEDLSLIDAKNWDIRFIQAVILRASGPSQSARDALEALIQTAPSENKKYYASLLLNGQGGNQ